MSLHHALLFLYLLSQALYWRTVSCCTPWLWPVCGQVMSCHALGCCMLAMGTPVQQLSPISPSWILFDKKDFQGDQHVLSEGEFPTLTAMGCLSSTVLGSLRKVPLVSIHATWVRPARCGRG